MAGLGTGALGTSAMAAVLQGCRAASTKQASSSGRRSAAPPAAIRAEHGKLVGADGQEVRLTGVNWFGLETPNFAPHGLWARNWQDMLDQVAAAGFNCIRLPFSNQVLDAGSLANSIDATRNPDLQGLTGLQVMDTIVEGAGRRGLETIRFAWRAGTSWCTRRMTTARTSTRNRGLPPPTTRGIFPRSGAVTGHTCRRKASPRSSSANLAAVPWGTTRKGRGNEVSSS